VQLATAKNLSVRNPPRILAIDWSVGANRLRSSASVRAGRTCGVHTLCVRRILEIRLGRGIAMRTCLAGLALSALLFSAPAPAFVDPPTLSPEHPVAGDLISVQIYAGICDAFTDDVDETDISIKGNQIRMLIDGLHYSDSAICIYPKIHYVFPVGRFTEGGYVLQVDRRYQNFNGLVVIETLAITSFNVAGAPGQVTAIPTLGPYAMGLLVCGLILGAAFVVRRRRFFLITMIASSIFSTGAEAQIGQYLEVLLSRDRNAPTPSAVVAAFENGTSQPLAPLATIEPQSVGYLSISERIASP
jgi:hypothetical protein